MKHLLTAGLATAALASTMAFPAFAQDATVVVPATPAAAVPAVSSETAFVFNTLLFLIGGFLVMFMAAGFAMLEAGLVRSKNVSMQCLKNIGLYSVAGIMYWTIGYNLMYSGVDGGYLGSFGLSYAFDAVGIDATAGAGVLDTGYSTASDWFFQMAFVAATASIVSGAVAERIKIGPFMIFVIILTGFLYPISGSWKWGTGWLGPNVPDGFDSWADAIAAGQEAVGIVAITGNALFNDFAGSTIVHSVGGWAALTGAIILGPRIGKYVDGRVVPMVGSSIPLATLGTFILWLGWFGFNGGSQLALGSIGNAADVSRIFANTNLAAAGGVVAAMILSQLLYGKVDVTFALNGALAGLVSITAEPLAPSGGAAILIGAVGGVIVVLAVPMLDKMKIDDVVGAIPVHLFAGIWGTLAVPLTNGDATFLAQIIGILAYAVFTVVCSAIVWFVIKAIFGLRADEEAEVIGLDVTEVGVEAYPEFASGART